MGVGRVSGQNIAQNPNPAILGGEIVLKENNSMHTSNLIIIFFAFYSPLKIIGIPPFKGAIV